MALSLESLQLQFDSLSQGYVTKAFLQDEMEAMAQRVLTSIQSNVAEAVGATVEDFKALQATQTKHSESVDSILAKFTSMEERIAGMQKNAKKAEADLQGAVAALKLRFEERGDQDLDTEGGGVAAQKEPEPVKTSALS